MDHCLLLILFLLLIFECPISQLQNLNSTSNIDTNSSVNSEKSFSQPQKFKKTVFIIPLTGVLLVVSMVLLYLIYSWNEARLEGSRTRYPETGRKSNSPAVSNCSININPGTIHEQHHPYSNGVNRTNINELYDPPPSYFEAIHQPNCVS